jgi:hypothetical protein
MRMIDWKEKWKGREGIGEEYNINKYMYNNI